MVEGVVSGLDGRDVVSQLSSSRSVALVEDGFVTEGVK